MGIIMDAIDAQIIRPRVEAAEQEGFQMTQTDIQPPKFIVFVNDPELMHFSYLRFLENRLRESFGFEGTPLKLIVRGRKEEEDY